MAPLIGSRSAALAFLLAIAALTVAAMGLAALRAVPLKMLPYDNKNELLLVIDADEGTTLERTDTLVRSVEAELAGVPEVTDFVSYTGLAGPIDFNGLVRHYYLPRMPHNAEIRVNLVGKEHRETQSHGIALRLHDRLAALADRHSARLKIVELPPGPPVLSSLVAEIYGRPDHSYEDLVAAAAIVSRRLADEPGVVDVDDTVEAPMKKLVYVTDQEKAALNGVSVEEIARTLQLALAGAEAGTVRLRRRAQPAADRAAAAAVAAIGAHDLAAIRVQGRSGQFTPLSELGRWETARVDQTLYHKNLERLVYVNAETLGRTPAECVVERDGEPDGSRADPSRRVRRPARSMIATSCTTAAAFPGRWRTASGSISAARASGRSRWKSSATWAWPSPRR